MRAFTLIATIPCANTLGEGVQWNADDGSFWWTDIPAARLYSYQLASQQLRHWQLPEPLACFAFAKQDSRLLAAFASGVAWYNLHTGEREWLAKPEAHLPGNRSNDGRCDRQGRFWWGTIVERDDGQCASLYSLAHTGQVVCHLRDLRIANALCWSPDSRKLYHADSPSHSIRVYDFDAATGTLANGRLFAQTELGIEPDGACVDAEGYVWNAQWGAARVRRYTSAGAVALDLALPVSQPTCVAFGGDSLSLLAITSARAGLSDAQLAQQPEAGSLFIYATPYLGLAEPRFG